MGLVTKLIDDLGNCDREKTSTLFSLVYCELRSIAQHHMARESPGHTLQPTALVNEAFLKIVKTNQIRIHDRSHFLRLASRAMQRILVDRARTRKRLKRGGRSARKPLSDSLLTISSHDTDLLDLDEALADFEKHDSKRAELVRLHIFSGLTLEQCAHTLNTSTSTVERSWRFARAWLLKRMEDSPE